jgi:hypothetical protein
MRSICLENIVIELCSAGGFPLEEASEHFFLLNKCITFVVALINILLFH